MKEKSKEYQRGYKDGKADATSEFADRLLTAIIGAAFVSGLAGFNKALSIMKKAQEKDINTKTEKKKL